MRQRFRQQLGVALFALGAFAMHQLRYVLAFGSDASHELADQGHSYLHELTPWIMLAVAVGVGGLVARLARAVAQRQPDRGRGRRLAGLWALAGSALFAMYVGQEFLEGLLAAGHQPGLAGILGDGGWWALPAAIVIGGLLALVVRGSHARVARVARLRRERSRPAVPPAPRLAVRRAAVLLARMAPLAGAGAGRAPPAGARL